MTRSDVVQIPEPSIATLIDDYFEALWTQDMQVFDRVFHKDCVLYGVVDGNLNIRPYPIYREAVANRVSPSNTEGDVRRDSVLAYDRLSPNLAQVKAQLQMFGGLMNDYLNLVYVDGQWWVMAKMWDRIGDAVK
ncbi:MAG: hypothetical protein RLZZ603_1257 [Actinomycetota bacterium]|jgi:hypothetical protein